ncbi:tRNA-dihydrouridine synthase family protein [Thauera aromatica]|uniref:tRNA dihydrouridine synthase n=1 Tax=Thauera aromatica TaxID=59405 RepID=UPI001FFD4EA6|nr:tRNA-dihydrouridine synthase family protein [Thauera aromatica]MCK2089151.1 tRNA-dihydrouridine synthase family protein [Thauera aromatica]MCK2125418.1 tRNA-dihydrouridine synthase family protein [Thauera aromatica]
MRLLLAPMEGLLDEVLRAMVTRLARYDYAVTEFARVSGTLLPDRFFRRIAPELDHASRTAAGTPVRVQILGSDPGCMADNAARLARLAPAGVDLNFGCPAPTVNRHRGGAVLLDEPELLHRIAAAVAAALPAGVPLTAKMRLGVADPGRACECAQALAGGGATALVVHARTRQQGYRPPAHWEWVARVAQAVRVPVVANGEVWTAADWVRCRTVSGVADVMLGRGAVADPFLAGRIRDGRLDPPDVAERAREWQALLPVLGEFSVRVQRKVEARHAPGRIKQWLHLLARSYPQARHLFAAIRGLRTLAEVEVMLGRHGVPLPGAQSPAPACAA